MSVSNISSSVQILIEEAGELVAQQARRLHAQIDEQTERARRIVRTLLDFARDRLGDGRRGVQDVDMAVCGQSGKNCKKEQRTAIEDIAGRRIREHLAHALLPCVEV